MALDAKSMANLKEAHPLLQKLFTALAADPKTPKFQILDARRGRAEQERAFALGHSRAHFGQSAHNYVPAVALDVVPIPLDWRNIASFVRVSIAVKAKAKELGIPIEYGGDWKSIKDYPHYELKPWRAYATTLYKG